MTLELCEKLHQIDVPIRVATSPRAFSRRLVQREATTAFMIDIRTRRGRSRPMEYVLVYCGSRASVRVLDVDRRHQQVLLAIREPGSRLTTRRWDRKSKRVVEDEILIEAARRRMLVGMDESHLFICPLARNASSVREAHRKLAPGDVHSARRRLKVRRQGEWFFVPARSRVERTRLGEAQALGLIRQNVGLTAGGRPHFVQEHMGIDAGVFARGRVRHPDHKVIVLKDWHRVLRNTEDVTVRPTGMSWVD